MEESNERDRGRKECITDYITDMMTNYDKERLAILEYERDNAIKHKCPRVAAARQREIDKTMKRYGNADV